MDLWIMLDIIVVGIFVLCVLSGIKKGFMRSVYHLLSFVITIVAVVVFLNPFADYLMKTTVATSIETHVKSSIDKVVDKQINDTNMDSILDGMGLPDFLKKSVLGDVGIDIGKGVVSDMDISTELAKTATDKIVRVLAGVILFVIIKILLGIVLLILDGVFSLPILNGINKLAGGVVGVVNAGLLVYGACAIIVLLMPIIDLQKITSAIDKTLITKCFYQHNLLMNIFVSNIFVK